MDEQLNRIMKYLISKGIEIKGLSNKELLGLYIKEVDKERAIK